jgi:nucleoid DNA-binding protein
MAGFLVIDYTINKFIQQLQTKYRDQGKEISYGTIVNVIEAQLKAIPEGMAQGDTIMLKKLGTFVATKKRVDILNKQYEKKGKKPGLVDKGLTRMSFKRDGEFYNKIDLFFPNRLRDIREYEDYKKSDMGNNHSSDSNSSDIN